MKYTKMSLVAALLVGSSAFAIDNVKVSGDAKLYYSTTQDTADLFNKAGSAADVAASISVTADLTKGVSFGGKATALSTLGLEGQLVGGVWENPNGLSDSYIVNDLWLATTVGKTTAKIGRMELDTPLVFTEKWSIVENTFEAAVVINTDIPGTTLVGAYVGGSNGSEDERVDNDLSANLLPSAAGVIGAEAANTTFDQFYVGAFAVGVVNNSYEPLTVQAWYYDASKTATAYWLQADLDAGKLGVDGLTVGAQFAGEDLSKAVSALESNTVYAVMAGYEMKDMFTAKLSYSAVSDDAGRGAGSNLAGSGQSKLYTEAWWNYGVVTARDTTAFNLTVEAPVKDIADLGFYATIASASVDNTNDLTEITMTASHTFGPLDTTAALIYADKNDNKSGIVQAYLTYNF
jgi:hypothetical protein